MERRTARFLEALAELLWPTRCAGCDLPGALLCDDCREALPHIESSWSCPRCGAPYGWLVCTECWQTEFAFEAALSVGVFEAPLARAVVLHKDGGEQRLASVLGVLVAEAIAGQWPGWPELVTFVPASSAAVTRRGFDHGQAIARAVAAGLDIEFCEVLSAGRTRDQRLLGRTARAANVAGVFAATAALTGRIVVVDDVMTTRATADAAAQALLAAGADAVRVATVARAW